MFDLFRGGIPTYLRKFKTLNSSASEIDAVANTINPLLSPIHKLFRESANGIKAIKYIVSGDSTRNRVGNRIVLDYYVPMLAQLNISVYNNADASQSAYDWQNNLDQNTLQQAIDNSLGTDGEDTILEYSFGLNDYSNFIATKTESEIKEYIKNGVLAYRNAKPKAQIILVKPPKTEALGRTAFIDTCYNELALELNLPMVDSYVPTAPYVFNSSWYDDPTHPNMFLSTRLVNYIFEKIIPNDLRSRFYLLEWVQPDSIVKNLLYGVGLVQGYYQTAAPNIGILLPQTKSRATAKFDIDDRFSIIRLLVNNTRFEVFFYDATGACMTTSTLFGDGKVPRGAKQCALNLFIGADAAAATAWESANGTLQVVKYIANVFRPQYECNENLVINLPIQTKRKNKVIDNYGFTGESGESLKIDSSLKMKWSV